MWKDRRGLPEDVLRSSLVSLEFRGFERKCWDWPFPELASTYQGRDLNLGQTMQQVSTSWAMGTFGPYISSSTTTMDGASAKRVDQTLDSWGNLATMKVYDINSPTVRRTYTNVYKTDSGFMQKYMRNRLYSSTVADGTSAAVTMVTNGYDVYSGGIVAVNNMRQFDYGMTTSTTARGNMTSSVTLGGTSNVFQIDQAGNVMSSSNSQGVSSSSSLTASTNYAVPSAVTVGSLTSNFVYEPDLLPRQATGPNGDTASTIYDSYARPKQSTSKIGATTYFNYTTSAVISYTNPNLTGAGRVTRTTLDGFGRTMTVETGTGSRDVNTGVITLSSWVSIMSTEFAPCGCSPLGS